MFDPIDYLNLAKRLAQCSDSDALFEAKQRSATSRAYYSAFITARNIEGTPTESHTCFIKKLQKYKNATWRLIGQDLETIRDNRNKADYEDYMSEPQWVAETTILLAECILERIKSLSNK